MELQIGIKWNDTDSFHMEGSYMGDSRRFFEQAGEGTPGVRDHEHQNGVQNVQNPETIINEGLRIALMEETPDQSLEVLLEHLGKALNGDCLLYTSPSPRD